MVVSYGVLYHCSIMDNCLPQERVFADRRVAISNEDNTFFVKDHLRIV